MTVHGFSSIAPTLLNERASLFVGAAWEHEFSGKVQAAASGFALDAPTLMGDAGAGVSGANLKPPAAPPLSFELGAQGCVGKREELTGSVRLKFEP